MGDLHQRGIELSMVVVKKQLDHLTRLAVDKGTRDQQYKRDQVFLLPIAFSLVDKVSLLRASILQVGFLCHRHPSLLR